MKSSRVLKTCHQGRSTRIRFAVKNGASVRLEPVDPQVFDDEPAAGELDAEPADMQRPLEEPCVAWRSASSLSQPPKTRTRATSMVKRDGEEMTSRAQR